MPQDSFPLSYYPMFSFKRKGDTKITYLVGFDSQGNRKKLPYQFAGQGGLNQVRKQIVKFVRKGQAEKLCKIVASKAALSTDTPDLELVSVQIVTGTFNLTDYFKGQTEPGSEKVHSSCPVVREGK